MAQGALWRVSDDPGLRCACGVLMRVTAAIASNLAKGIDTPTAVQSACRYIEAAIRTAPGLGKGHGPLNHFHSTYTLPFAP
jgi:hydroxymethylpyrimidine/phosphomethylpyrimidine kinase